MQQEEYRTAAKLDPKSQPGGKEDHRGSAVPLKTPQGLKMPPLLLKREESDGAKAQNPEFEDIAQ